MKLHSLIDPLFESPLFDYPDWAQRCYISEAVHKKKIKQRFGVPRRFFMNSKRLLAVIEHIKKAKKPTLDTALKHSGFSSKRGLIKIVYDLCETSWKDFKNNPSYYEKLIHYQIQTVIKNRDRG